MSWRSKREEVVPDPAPDPAEVDDAVAKRLAELTHREVALRKITEAVEKQRTRLEERERAVERSAEAVAVGEAERIKEATRRADQAERAAEQAERRAKQAERRVRELEQRLATAEARPKTPPPAVPIEQERVASPTAPAEEPAPAPAPALEAETTEGTYTLQRLERLVEEGRLRGDPAAEEWAYYLPLLREHAEPDGRLPAQFASLVDTVFAE